MKAGTLVWVRDFEPHPLNCAAIVSDVPSVQHGKTRVVINGNTWAARTKCIRTIATAAELKKLATTNQGVST